MATIAIIGFMAVGKTAVAKVLANRLKYEVVDLDHIIVEEQEMSIGEIFTTYGEDYFRELEKEALKTYCMMDRVVIATGGGAVLSAKNREMLKDHCYTICLTSQAEEIVKRAQKDGQTRPILANAEDPLNHVQTLLDQRQAFYEQADLHIDTTERNINQVVEAIMSQLELGQ